MAVVLVGGEGTRLRPLTYTTPKPLLPICNRPFLELQLEWLAGHGIDEIVLSLGYLPDPFRDRFPGDRMGGVRLRYAVEPEPLGTGGAIRFAAEGAGERFVVCNGDVLTDLDLGAMLRFHEEARAEATIALTRVEDPSRFGVVPTTPEGRVLAFVEKPPADKAPSQWINAGTYVLEASILDRIPAGVPVSVEREVFPRVLETGGRLFAVRSDAFWLDIGVPAQYLDANRHVLRGGLSGSPAPDAIIQAPGVWVQGEVSVDPGARLVPPVLLGEGSVVEVGASVKASVLGPGCVVGAGASVVDSVILEGAGIGEGARVEESIVGPGARLHPGAVVAGLSVIAAGAVVEAGLALTGARIDPPGMAG